MTDVTATWKRLPLLVMLLLNDAGSDDDHGYDYDSMTVMMLYRLGRRRYGP